MVLMKTRSLFFITALVLFAAYWLFHDLTRTSLWADEGWTIAATNSPNPITVIRDWVYEDVHPPLFFVGLSLWRVFTGDTIFAMRVYSVFITLIGVAFMYRLARLMFGERAGWVAALLFSLHDLVLVLTQEVRHYPQQQTLTILALYTYWRFWRKPTRRRGVLFIIAGSALLYSHYWGGFVLLALGLHAFITRYQHLRPYLLANLGILLTYSVWLPAIYHQITLERPGGLPHALENSWVVYKTLAYQLMGVPELFWMLLAFVGIAGTFTCIQPRKWLPTPSTLACALVVILTVGLSLLINTRYPTLSFRSLAVIIPPSILLIAHTLQQFRRQEFTVLVVFIIIQSITTTSAQPLARPPWPNIANFISLHSAHDGVLLEMNTDDLPMLYYLEHTDAPIDILSSETLRLHQPDQYATDLADFLQKHDGVWLIKFGYFEYDIRPEILAQGFVQSAPTIDYGRYADGRPIELYRYDRIPEDIIVQFGTALALTRQEVTLHDDVLTINLLWSPIATPQRNYTISTFLLTEQGLLALPNKDNYPFEGRSPTINWQAEQYYFDSHTFNIANLPSGHYRVG
ncbi:MAG: hypothetical protein CUN55_14745, partial [Phototrophicales bacterium]